jgi:Cu(I)/Ag(I) efflux system membrane fusion protein/cobalt-zinc-cadmium efflux system membrane fusion protein
MNNYRSAFWLAVAGNLALAAVLAGLWWRSHSTQVMVPAATQADSVQVPKTPGPAPMAAMPAEPVLAPIPLSSPRMQGLPVRFGTVTRKPVRDEIRTTGNVMLDESRLAYVQMRISGWIRKVFVAATYQRVEEGQPLFTIFSPDVVATEREYVLALQNQQRLLESTVPGVTAGADALPAAALERLRQWGVPEAEIERLQTNTSVKDEIEIGSPVNGTIVEREALPNKFVEPNTRLYTVADLTHVWVIAQVFQRDVGRIREGDAATVTVDAHAGQSFAGRVDFIYPDVDMATRTTRVRLVLPNPNLTLTPGMFANVTFHVSMGQQLTIPASGLLQTGTRSIVFVDDGKGYLQPREVELGPRLGDDFVVVKGLRAGERIVTSANFLIDSESQLQAALRSFEPPASTAGSSAGDSVAMPAAAQAKLSFETEPSPPHKGSNTFRVRLTDAGGAPISGAEVSVTFVMPAMPAMGMAEMRVESKLSDDGNGNYHGTGSLETTGTWQVTVTARRAGRVVASRQMSLNASGGM